MVYMAASLFPTSNAMPYLFTEVLELSDGPCDALFAIHRHFRVYISTHTYTHTHTHTESDSIVHSLALADIKGGIERIGPNYKLLTTLSKYLRA